MPSTETSVVDGLSTSVAIKAPCATVATSNVTLEGLQTIGGVTLAEGARVLCVAQSDAKENGIYSASTGQWQRTQDADGNRDLVQGTRVLVRSASTDGVEYELLTANPIVIGTSNLVFALRYGANALYDQTDAEIAAGVVPTDYSYPPLYLRRYGGQPGMSFDNTDAMEAAQSVCAEQGGGIIVLDIPGEWCMNFTFLHNNVKIYMAGGGNAEFDENCIRPYNLASAPLTVASGEGGLENQVRYCGLINCHVSGTNRAQGTGVSPPAANCAPHALLMKGGSVGFKADLFCAFYSGIRTVSFEPSADAPVAHCRIYGVIRNDVTDSADARCIYSIRYADPGYNTSNYVDVKLNKTGMGRPAEVVGSGVSITALFAGYWDIPAGSGGILLNNASIDSDGLHLDPGTLNDVVIETTDSNTDISRVLRGRIIADGQKWKNGSGTEFSIPSGSAQFSFRQVIRQPYVRHPIYIAGTDGSYRETVYRDMLTNDGPEILYGIGEGLGTANNARWVRGHISEEITLSTSGLTTDSVADLLPANSIIEAVCTRTTEAIATATDWAVGDSSVSNRFLTASSTLTLGFTRIGLRHHDGTGTSGPIQNSAAKLRITCTGSNPTTGKVRATVFYRTFVAPAS